MTKAIALLIPISLLVSCSPNQPGQGSPVAPPVNSSNPYGVPGVGDAGAYAPEAAPYQPLDPVNPPATSIPSYTPAPATPSSANLNGNVYTIVKGDSLWGISRKFGTSVEEIKSINGLVSDTIIEGRTLIIPNR